MMLYQPKSNGFSIRIRGNDVNAPQASASVKKRKENIRLHRRPLYPSADRSQIWSADELNILNRTSFRPLILAFNNPFFVFDFHNAGGILGSLKLGIIIGETSKWLHDFELMEVQYSDGRMEYELRDPDYPTLQATIVAVALSDAVGGIFKITLDGIRNYASVVFAYGGASSANSTLMADEHGFTINPNHTSKDKYAFNGLRFKQTRAFDENDPICHESLSAPRLLKDWSAVVQGGISGRGQIGTADAKHVNLSPRELLTKTNFKTQESEGGIVVGEINVDTTRNEGTIIIGMGNGMNEAINRPRLCFDNAVARNEEIADRIVSLTPDPFLDSSIRMMSFSQEGSWGDLAYMHGAWSRRSLYLGWRNLYGPIYHGWFERVKKHILNHLSLSRIKNGDDAGTLSHSIEDDACVFYNMNEVFLDMIKLYLKCTGDKSILKELFEAVNGIVEWENRRLKPNDEPLYESALNTWISDSHWYIKGHCIQASAYMANAYDLLALIAKHIGADPEPYAMQSNAIRTRCNELLWQERKGVFAEYKDTRGEQLLHPEPELATLYLSAEFNLADVLQTYLMCEWAENNLRSETTPNGGLLYWSSNWHPNSGRQFTHSTYDLAYAEALNFALTQYKAGRNDYAYSILQAVMNGIYNGKTPGGLSCHCNIDGTQRKHDEFSDAVSMYNRTIVEGMFGIEPNLMDGIIHVTPRPPTDWEHASVTTPFVNYSYKNSEGIAEMEWRTHEPAKLYFHFNLHAEEIVRVLVDGEESEYIVEPFIDSTTVQFAVPKATSGVIKISYIPRERVELPAIEIVQGETKEFNLLNASEVVDKQKVLESSSIEEDKVALTVSGEPGPATLFVKMGSEECPYYQVVRINITPADNYQHPKVWVSPKIKEKDITLWHLLDIDDYINCKGPDGTILRVVETAVAPALPYSQVGFEYWKEHLTKRCLDMPLPPSDAAWRKKVGRDNVGWTGEGIPFYTPKTGNNIAGMSLEGDMHKKISIEADCTGSTLYLMFGCMTFPNQSHTPNLRVKLNYSDGEIVLHELINPYTIADTWSNWFGRYYNCIANGFENTGCRDVTEFNKSGLAMTAEAVKAVGKAVGKAGITSSKDVKKLQDPIEVDTCAQIAAFPLLKGKTLDTIEIEVAANDIIVGLYGATILK